MPCVGPGISGPPLGFWPFAASFSPTQSIIPSLISFPKVIILQLPLCSSGLPSSCPFATFSSPLIRQCVRSCYGVAIMIIISFIYYCSSIQILHITKLSIKKQDNTCFGINTIERSFKLYGLDCLFKRQRLLMHGKILGIKSQYLRRQGKFEIIEFSNFIILTVLILQNIKVNQFANQLNLMQESSVVNIPTPRAHLNSLFSASTEQETPFQKFIDLRSVKFSAFKLVKSHSEKENSQKLNQESQNGWIGKRRERGSYRKYTIDEKQQAVFKIMGGHDVKEISKQYRIPRRNLLRWKKNGCQRKQGGGRPTDNQLQKMLYTKISNNDLKSQRQIRQEARKLSKGQNFKASKGWYCKFNKRFTNWNQKISLARQTVTSANGQYQNK